MGASYKVQTRGGKILDSIYLDLYKNPKSLLKLKSYSQIRY